MTLMLIGNKTDLAKLREVKTEDAGNYAEKEQMALIETSALDSSNVSLAFECIIKGKPRVPNDCRDLQAAASIDAGGTGGIGVDEQAGVTLVRRH